MPSALASTRPPSVTLLTVAASICAHLLSLAVPLALLQTYDRILPNESYSTAFVLTVGVAIAILLEAVLRYGRAVLLANVGATFESSMSLRLLDRIMQASRKDVHALGAPTLSDALRAVGQARDFWSGNAAVALHELPFIAIYIGLIAYIGSWLAVIPLALTIVAFLAAIFVARAAAHATFNVEAAEKRRRDLAWGIFSGIVEVKAMAAETMMTRRYHDAVAATMRASARVEDRMALIRENGALLSQLSTIGVLTFGTFMVVTGELTTGGLAACTLLAGRSIGPAMSAFAYLSRLGFRDEAERKLTELLSLPKSPLSASCAGDLKFTGGTIEISGDALREGRVSIPQGSIVHVEASDSRAATATLDAIAQIDDTLRLVITYDGKPLEAFNKHGFKAGVAIASANPGLIGGSVLDNLTLFSPQFNSEAIRLTQRLGLDTFVDGLHQGFMTPVGPAGADILSPGIEVRIGLIRALVRRPAILCLDEVGGTLDLDGLRKLIGILKELKGRTTVFLVSSHPELQALADQTIHIVRETPHE